MAARHRRAPAPRVPRRHRCRRSRPPRRGRRGGPAGAAAATVAAASAIGADRSRGRQLLAQGHLAHAAREAERELICKMLQRTRWNRKEAAEILGISYKALLYKIKENGLDKAS